MSVRIAVIGAGLAGVAVARRLSDVAEVTVFEKSRGLGGRMATRRAGEFQFDHGAQFFTARSAEFQELLAGEARELVSGWDARVVTLEAGKKAFKREWFETHYVAQPQMNSLVKGLASALDVSTGVRIGHIASAESGWRLEDEDGKDLGHFDWVISSAPAPQTVALMPDCFNGREALHGISFSSCFALMLGFASAPTINFDAALLRHESLAWLALNSKKPGRDSGCSLLLHSNNHWANRHQDDDPDWVAEAMLKALTELTGIDTGAATHSALHRWLYARAETDLERDYLLDTENRLATCGDWCRGNRVEDAYLSGLRLGEKLLALLAN
jgi:hypothetical protein